MKLFLFIFLIRMLVHGSCNSDAHIGYQVSIPVPTEYSGDFIGRAFLLEVNQRPPNFRAALSVEAINEKYTCSLDVFLGELKVWSSGHLSPFYVTEKCVIVLNEEGDLQLKGHQDQVGWRAGTSGQGVERLQLQRDGNLVLVDAFDQIKWQTFNFPTDIMLWGQRLSLKTRLTSFPNNSTSFYSFEIQHDKIALYLNSGSWKYPYWEFKPNATRNITYVELDSKKLDIFADQHSRIAEIQSQRIEPLRFLALENRTGSLGLYYYSPEKEEFVASFQAPNTTCDHPLACKPYGICTFANACSCIRVIARGDGDALDSGCSSVLTSSFCSRIDVEMFELRGVSTVLRGSPAMVNVSKEDCANSCLHDCNCVAALYFYTESRECFLYGLVIGVRQVEMGSGMSYMVKLPKGTSGSHSKSSGLRKWVVVVVSVADGLILLFVLGGLGYYVIRKRRKNSADNGNAS